VAGASPAAGGDAPPSSQAIAARALDSARRHHCLPSPLSPPTLDPIIAVVLARIPAAGAPTQAQLHHESAVSIPSLCSSDCAEAITDDDASSLLRPSAARQSSSTTKKKFLYSSCCPVYCLRRMCCSLRSLRGHVLCNFRSWKRALDVCTARHREAVVDHTPQSMGPYSLEQEERGVVSAPSMKATTSQRQTLPLGCLRKPRFQVL